MEELGINFSMPDPRDVGVLIIGAGPTGIGAAVELHQAGYTDWLMVDSAPGPGGMATTTEDEHGFRWDLGGHVIHSHFVAFDELVVKKHSDWVHPRRSGWVRINDTWCPTPIQRNLGSLAEGALVAQQLISENKNGESRVTNHSNLEDYYVHTFGPTLNRLFFAPYNTKQWAWPLSQLSHTWTSLRSGSKDQNVPVADASSSSNTKYVPEDTTPFDYPRLGTGALWQDIARRLPKQNQLYNTAATGVDLEKRVVKLATGESVTFKRCISTMPLSALVDLVSPVSLALSENARKLCSAETHLVGFGFQGPLPKVLSQKTWIFSADPDVCFHRASIPSNFSPNLAGPGRWSILFETSLSQHRHLEVQELAKAHLAELRRWGVEDEPISIWQRHLKFGYPLPFLGRDTVLDNLLIELEAFSILSRGRFGGWRYESSNQDYAFQQGIEAARFLLSGSRETAFWPTRSNSSTKLDPLQ